MGLFDFFRKEPRQSADAADTSMLEKIEIMPGLSLPRALAQHWDELAMARRSYNAITASRSEDPALEQSKFGHYPIMPLNFQYPKDAYGKFMFPLAQINCAEMPHLEGYPQSGYLQFYISGFDDAYGLDFDNNQSQKNARVLYFEEHETANYTADFSFLDDVMTSERLPLSNPHTLSFTRRETYVGIGDCQYDGKAFDIMAIAEKYSTIEDELEDLIYDEFSSSGHRVGGYAYFTQSDPRSAEGKTDEYVLLLQLDSDDDIVWGDAGVANFFIHPDDLKKRDFTKVLYNWDCS